MIHYAGYDPSEQPFEGQAGNNAHWAGVRFHMDGWDTMQIAEHWRVRESTALRWITQERSRRLGLADPYAR